MSSSSSLCPGFKQVDAFGPDDDYEDEEVAYVTLDLGNIEPTLVPSSSVYRLIGLDTPTPFLQLSGTILKGRHETLLGTELLFTDGKDPNDGSKRAVNHVASTEQRICFREVRLVPKGTAPAPSTSSKGKNKETAAFEGWEVEAEAASHMVDRITGKNAPRSRAPRKSTTSKKGKGTSKAKGKGKGTGKGKDKEQDEEDEVVESRNVEGNEGNGAGSGDDAMDIDEILKLDFFLGPHE
ncbi:hypothetical protein H0H93_008644 [Arthromyces matolae]|nr:hypothetical protein H0H93_008644 [Arthromyces matolae]